MISDGFEFLDGIAWSKEEGALFFSDAVGKLLRLGADDSVNVVGSDVKTRDFQFDISGRLVATETDDLRVTATNPDGTVKVLASDFEGLKFAAPNGVVVRSDGTVYFTDFVPGAEPGFDFRGVFAISPSGIVTAVHRYPADQGPNGIALSPDEQTLYVGNSFGSSVDMFDIALDGSLSAEPRQTITTTGSRMASVSTTPGTSSSPRSSWGWRRSTAPGHRWAPSPSPARISARLGRCRTAKSAGKTDARSSSRAGDPVSGTPA